MKLDPRIKDQSLIYTPFSNAQISSDEKGYFADEMGAFSDLDLCEYCELVEYSPALMPDRPYCGKRIGSHRLPNWFAFYIPESSLKPIVKKYRPYTLEEFFDKFTIGEPIEYRAKGADKVRLRFVLLGYREYSEGENIYIGTYPFTLKKLFEDYEWHDDETGGWRLFGVEE